MFTRADLEAEAIGDLRPYVAVTRLDATTIDGTNADLAGPIRKAILASGGAVADAPAVTDEDVATCTAPFDTVAFHVRLHTLYKCRGNWARVDMRQGMEEQKLKQLFDMMQAQIEDMETQLEEDPELVTDGSINQPPVSGVMEAGGCDPYHPLTGRFYPGCL